MLDGDAAVLRFDDATSAAAAGTYLSLDLRLSANSSVTVTVESPPPDTRTFRVVYVSSEHLLWTAGNVIYYGIGAPATRGRRRWSSVGRDLNVDVLKGSGRAVRRRPSSTYARLRRKEFLQHQMDAAAAADRIGRDQQRGTTTAAGRRQRRTTRENEAGSQLSYS